MTGRALTPRMIEVISWLSYGKTSDEAAELMNISKWTAKVYIRDAKEIVGASTASALVAKAIRGGWIE